MAEQGQVPELLSDIYDVALDAGLWPPLPLALDSAHPRHSTFIPREKSR
jgi:hypothetical protein